MDVAIGLRSRSQLQQVYDRGLARRRSLTRDHSPSNDRHIHHINGVVSAISWMLNKSLMPPIRNIPVPVTDHTATSAITDEIAIARAQLTTGVRIPSDHDYLTGALDALHWAISHDAPPPA